MSETQPIKTKLSIGLIGTRGVPAAYGGFETAVDEVGRRLVERGHRVTVYCREHGPSEFLGMNRVTLPAIRKKALETPSHTALSVAHAIVRGKPDVAIVFNAANSLFLPGLRLARIPHALHMDGLEWKRSKWGPVGQRYYRRAEEFGVRMADALIADSKGISEYYHQQFGAQTELIKYGAPQILHAQTELVEGAGLTPEGYHLIVARFEPENHVLEAIAGFRKSRSKKTLAVVGAAPYSESYTEAIQRLAESDPRIRLLGPVYEQELLDALYFHAYTYVHGHSVGGTNPSLLRAIGAGTAVIAFDVSFNRDVLADQGWYFTTDEDIANAFETVESSPQSIAELGRRLRVRAAEHYTWDGVTDEYERLALALNNGYTSYPIHRKLHRMASEWEGHENSGGASAPTTDASNAH